MHTRPHLLFLSQTLPYPPDSGVQIRTFNIMRLLARAFDITALCFYRWKRGTSRVDIDSSARVLRDFGDVEVFKIPQEHSRMRFVWDHLRSTAFRRVYTRYVYGSRDFRSRLVQTLRGARFQLVHVDSIDLAAYLPLLGSLPVVCVHHNVESMLLRRRATVQKSRWRRRYLEYQAGLVEGVEREWCGRLNLNVSVSPQDEAALRRLAPNGRFTVVPNGVDTDAFRPGRAPEKGIVFVGGNTWFPNRDALDYFCDAIWPLIRSTGDTPRVQWVGWSSSEDQAEFASRYGIELTGFVPDTRPYVQNAACYVVPLRVGGGTRLKILYAWAMGKAVVSTSVGCEGLQVTDGQNILIRDTPAEFAAAVRDVLADETLRRRLGTHGRETVERLYSWEVIGHHMLEQYQSCIRP